MKTMDRVDSGHNISLLTPRMSVLGATHQHWRSTMLSSISYVSERCGRISRWCALRGPFTMPRPRDSRRERGKKKCSTPAKRDPSMEHPFFFYNEPIQLPGPCCAVCKREDASNSAVVTYNADMSCPAGHGRLSGSQFQELHVSAAQSSEVLSSCIVQPRSRLDTGGRRADTEAIEQRRGSIDVREPGSAIEHAAVESAAAAHCAGVLLLLPSPGLALGRRPLTGANWELCLE